MRGINSGVVIDACVLANHGVCDLLLRLAESPRLHRPRWSEHILEETNRTRVTRLSRPAPLADHWGKEVAKHFPEALIEEAACLDPLLVNHPKDRHVLATAIRSGASTIVTFNLKDFSPASLSPWNIRAVHPSDFLISMHAFNPDQVLMRIAEMAGDRIMTGEMRLSKLNGSVPDFIEHIAKSAGERHTSPHQLFGFRSSWKKTGTPGR
jgi:predicted nucleic acid-binding protein